ncbi:ROK family protein [Brenneria tiliae]|uniref:ROK family protein n=1 Tax=Brenneria tiliae TaxID=2914984 RepID=A0ABT0MUF5_9GAMM|nr:ROK family protein [Brenneria tiliae]MCL2893412.1 ROK family protein [Brenneria tiliae]
MLRLGMDIGGSKIEVQVLDDAGRIRYRQRTVTSKENVRTFVDQICSLVSEAETVVGQSCSIGLGLPGSPDPCSGRIKNSNILTINQQPLQQLLTDRLHRPVAIANDANCFTLSEAIDGAGAGLHSVVGVILGTGCGGGVVIDRRLQQGKNGNCGEWGHIPLPYYQPARDGEPHRCYCGQLNCIESFISGTGVARQLSANYRHSVDCVSFFSQLSKQEDPQALALLERIRDQLARSLAMIVNMLDPDIIILGGGLSNVPLLYTNIASLMGQYTFGHYCNTLILPAQHGDSSGVRGAAWLGSSMEDTMTR